MSAPQNVASIALGWSWSRVSPLQLLRVRLPQPTEVQRPAVLPHQGGAPLALL